MSSQTNTSMHNPMHSPTHTRRRAVAALLDVAAVLLFVALGRRTHDEDGSWLGGALEVAAPFLIGLAVGWLIARAWRAPTDPATGVQVWLSTLVIGMLLRRFVFDDGTALPFVIVATVFLGALLVGWRLVAERLSARRAPA
jgi:hypothetical protein